jgi:hypothetical protein
VHSHGGRFGDSNEHPLAEISEDDGMTLAQVLDWR